MLRRAFVKSVICAAIGGSVLTKDDKVVNKQPKFMTPTHTVEVESKEDSKDRLRFPLVVRDDIKIVVGDNMTVTSDDDEEQEYIVTKITDTRNEHLEEI